jgi:hypothetical protein
MATTAQAAKAAQVSIGWLSPLRGSKNNHRLVPTAHAVGYRSSAAPRLKAKLIQSSKHKVPSTKLKAQSSKHKAQSSKLKAQN